MRSPYLSAQMRVRAKVRGRACAREWRGAGTTTRLTRTVLVLPLPGALHELFAAEVVPCLTSLGLDQFFDDDLDRRPWPHQAHMHECAPPTRPRPPRTGLATRPCSCPCQQTPAPALTPNPGPRLRPPRSPVPAWRCRRDHTQGCRAWRGPSCGSCAHADITGPRA